MNRLHTRRKSDRRFILFLVLGFFATAFLFYSVGRYDGSRAIGRSDVELR